MQETTSNMWIRSPSPRRRRAALPRAMLMCRRWWARAVVLAACSLAYLPLINGCRDSGDDASRVENVFGEQGMGAGQFAYPRAMAISPTDGCVFVVDKSARVQRFSTAGRYETGWKMPESENGKPTGVCVDRDNRVWVADTHYSRVIVFDREGKELFRFGKNGQGPGEFIWPTNIAIDSDGFIYVAEYGGNDRINKFTPQREYVLSFAHGEEEQGGTARPQGLAFDRRGILWVADAAHHRICRYTRDGEFLGAWGSMGDGECQFRYPYDVAVLADQTLIVCDYGNNRIVHMSQDGHGLGSWGGPGTERGQVYHPWSIDPGADGRLYVLDSWNNRVQVVKW